MKVSVLGKDQLITDRWYVGRGRNGNVACWDGENFLTVSYKFDEPTVKIEPYYEADSGCFQPFLLVDEGQMIEPFGKFGWDAHYGKTLELPSPDASPSNVFSGADKLGGSGERGQSGLTRSMNNRPAKINIYWRRALLFAQLLARLETGRANQRDVRVIRRLLEDPGVTNRLIEKANRALEARRYQKRCKCFDGLISRLQRGEKMASEEFKVANPTEEELIERLQRAIDFYRPAFEGEERTDMTAITRELWQELFGHDIDVREQIIRPVLRRQAEAWLWNAPDHRARAQELLSAG